VHPIRLIVNDDLRRSRLTVFFRLLLAIPHIVLLVLWSVVVFFVAIVNWFATLFSGRSPDSLHAFQARFLRYGTQVTGYTTLLADPYPGFGGGRPYPIDLEVAPPERQNRWMTGFRIFLAIPALILANVLFQVLEVIAFLGWFVCLALGRMPQGMRDLGAYCLRYQQQTYAYLLLLTQRYPSLSPGVSPETVTPTV
jgi:Domain of unknown function (DUF4389)